MRRGIILSFYGIERGLITKENSDIAIHAKEILRVRERLNIVYQKHLTKPHTLEQIGKDLFYNRCP